MSAIDHFRKAAVISRGIQGKEASADITWDSTKVVRLLDGAGAPQKIPELTAQAREVHASAVATRKRMAALASKLRATPEAPKSSTPSGGVLAELAQIAGDHLTTLPGPYDVTGDAAAEAYASLWTFATELADTLRELSLRGEVTR